MNNLKRIFYEFQDFHLKMSWQRSLRTNSIEGYCLMYHNVTDDWTPDGISCRCPVRVFEHYLDAYTSQGYEFLSIDAVYQLLTNRRKGGKVRRFCLLTFDDIPDNVYQNAYPILQKRGIPFTIFVTSNFVDYYNPEKKIQFITRDHLLEMDKDPLCTVGAHTVSHPILRRVKNSFEEMKDNKEWLEILLGHQVDYLAYPYGKHSSINKKIQKQASRAGFKCAFSSIDAPMNDISSKHLFFLPRVIRN